MLTYQAENTSGTFFALFDIEDIAMQDFVSQRAIAKQSNRLSKERRNEGGTSFWWRGLYRIASS